MVTTEPERVRVLIVDDSALMRKLLADILAGAPEIEVIGLARDGEEAVQLTAKLKPDVVTLDVEMPGRSGLDILPDLLAAHDAAVLMISTHTKEGAAVTLTALERGAVDFLPKPERHQFTQMREGRDLLVSKVLSAAQTRRPRRRASPATKAVATTPETRTPSEATWDPRVPVPPASARCVVIGISTGGPQALGAVLPLLELPFPPILVVQHMPAQFTSVFAERLDRACAFEVKEAEADDRLRPDRVLIAPGGRHMALVGTPPKTRVALADTPPVSGHRPSIDVLFLSAARTFQAGTVAVIMTGMGRDGVDGCKKVLEVGGVTFGQDEATSAVYGMNKAAMAEGALSAQFALGQLPSLIKKFSRDK